MWQKQMAEQQSNANVNRRTTEENNLLWQMVHNCNHYLSFWLLLLHEKLSTTMEYCIHYKMLTIFSHDFSLSVSFIFQLFFSSRFFFFFRFFCMLCAVAAFRIFLHQSKPNAVYKCIWWKLSALDTLEKCS